MPGRSFRNNFTSGVLDPKLGARSDLEQWRTGMSEGTNVFLLPHGGVRRRPGIRWTKSPNEKGRLGRFKFSKAQQYMLRFDDTTMEVWDAVASPPTLQTTLTGTPYTSSMLDDLYLKAQIADTMVIFHPQQPPHRFFRQTCPSNPIETLTSGKLRVRLPAHDFIDGDVIALSGITAFGNYDAGVLNHSATVETVSGTVAAATDLRVVRANTVEVKVGTSYGFKVGDTIELSGFDALANSASTVSSDQINRSQDITDIRGRFTFTAAASATATGWAGGSTVVLSQADAGKTIRTVAGSNLLYVQAGSFTGLRVGDTVNISSSTATGGLTTANINGDRTVQWVNSDGTFFKVQAGATATSSATGTCVVTVSLSLSSNPFYTTNGSATVTVDAPAWFVRGLGNSITVSGAATTTNGIVAANINGSRTPTKTDLGSYFLFAVESPGATAATQTKLGKWKANGFFLCGGCATPGGSMVVGTNLTTTNGSSLVSFTISNGSSLVSGFVAGDYITVDGIISGTTNGIPEATLESTHKIVSVGNTYFPPNQVITVDVGVAATATGTVGTAGTWQSASQIGGGTAVRVWSLTSMDPADDRSVKLSNIPQFDYNDGSSPQPRAEQQELSFTGFTAGDTYTLVVNMPGVTPTPGRTEVLSGPTVSIRTTGVKWNADAAVNASVMQTAINKASNEGDVVSVTYLRQDGSAYVYRLQFLYPRPIDLVQFEKVTSVNGIAVATQIVDGGSTVEDVISDARGWPSGGVFYQRRLWMFGLPSRPATMLASQIEDFFNFDVGDGLDSEAIDVTGDFDPVKHVVAERGLFVLTESGEVMVSGGGDNAAITPGNINLQVASRYGATSVPPVSISGRPVYVDSVARNIRQFGASADSSNNAESKEISILSQSLINAPVRMDLWRNPDGDYVFVANGDGTGAVLNINIDQQVVGWTKASTAGSFVDVCTAGEKMFLTVNYSGGYYFGYFDYSVYTDKSSILPPTTYGGVTVYLYPQFAFPNNTTVQVRADSKTLDNDLADGNGIVELKRNGVTYSPTVQLVEAGLAIPTPTIVPMAPQVDQYAGISKASVDLYESREVFVNGYKLRESLVSPGINNNATITGFRPIQLRGYGDRKSVTITAPNPQPMHVRAIEMEIV